ncbi:MAG: 8-oxo-dGTP diphosphatase [Candidatus Saccharibacteria bacterium]|nr:8-oxo-dGTP diphosphatase [Candidatus Saccharibacteria bacterium]
MKDLTLLFLLREGEVLLAMKKRGWGQGRWNGVGGKVEPGESIEAAASRECQEEIGVTPLQFTKQAIHIFHFPEHDGVEPMKVHVFVCRKWHGEPKESEEMKPAWFKHSAVPYTDMWPDDMYWLPMLLNDFAVTAEFTFDKNDQIIKMSLERHERLAA